MAEMMAAVKDKMLDMSMVVKKAGMMAAKMVAMKAW